MFFFMVACSRLLAFLRQRSLEPYVHIHAVSLMIQIPFRHEIILKCAGEFDRQSNGGSVTKFNVTLVRISNRVRKSTIRPGRAIALAPLMHSALCSLEKRSRSRSDG